MKKRILLSAALMMMAAMIFNFQTSSAHSIDYLAASISPAGTFNGQSGNFTVTNPVNGGDNINFSLTFSIVEQGQTTVFPRTITFGTTVDNKPSGAATPTVSSVPDCTFTSAASTCVNNITVTAPTTPGTYSVKIKPESGTGGQNGLSGGGGILVHFTVADPGNPCEPAGAQMTVEKVCARLHQTAPVTLRATLLPNVAGKTVNFSVDGVPAGSGFTDSSGKASVSFDVSSLSVGDHTIIASFDGDCEYEAVSNSNTLGITYGMVSFQQPINADGSSIFKSVKTIPVKIIVKDANGVPVTDAEAHVFFAPWAEGVLGTESEGGPLANTNGDNGNKMRLSDALIGQYIFNWNTTGLPNGTYRIRVDLGEGECGTEHTVLISFKRK